MKSINEVVKEKKSGLYFGNRVLLPFSCHIIKLNIENDLITDFSPFGESVHVSENPDFMEIYFHDYKDLKEVVSKFEAIKMIVVEKGKDVFNTKNHITLALHPEDNHQLRIEKLGENQIFIE
ncbi:MAG: hypothetical protein OQJ93_00270 [Ignavibacteriaceae bacterium]|jgi:hypothetical protein|nr:hypothetical protein [Ignavibacteriaceae bacterium]MCW8812848.1 hypothetical protein [Chlorobium sp.]MCW8817940.1 hypothetical protein [Ignavibacteriaceae bacterium]MCW8824230.1 hypothetical protein [Ignavibacteriaceae bacterium]MCW9095796.1 hypothetical protein [Ignavibacteriaceae bacterium]